MLKKIMSALTVGGANKTPVESAPDQEKTNIQPERKPVTKKDVQGIYDRDLPSFVDLLPYAGYDNATKTFILEDMFSRAKVYTIEPVATEGRDTESLIRYRDKLTEFLEQSFHQYARHEGQWIIQQFSYDDPNIDRIADEMESYAAPHAQGTEFTKHYIDMQRKHLQGIANNQDGIFIDNAVTKSAFVGGYRQTKLIIYRRCTQSNANDVDFCPAEEINEVMDTAIQTLESGGFRVMEDTPKKFFSWLLDLFNPDPEMGKKDFHRIYDDILAREADGELPIGDALCNSLVMSPPRSDNKNNCWWFDDQPMRFMRIGGLRSIPRIGQLTGEVVDGELGSGSETVSCGLDRLPTGAILSSTTIICPQVEFDGIIQTQSEKSYGGSTSASRKGEALQKIAQSVGRSDLICRNFSGLYIRGKNLKDLKKRCISAYTTLHNCGLKPLTDRHDPYSVKAFLFGLPMAFNPEFDAKYIYHKPIWCQHVANLSFAYGRDLGTKNPCYVFFNRGGSPLCIDPFNKNDRENNTFGLVLGAPGSGKSATSCYLATSIMAIYRPRMFIFDPGNSFGLLGDYFSRYGLKTAKMSYSADKVTPLCLFADAYKLVEIEDSKINTVDDFSHEIDKIEEDAITDSAIDLDDETVERDILGELEIIALMMITGGEVREYESYRRADRQMLRRSIVDAAKRCHNSGVMVRPQHILEVLDDIANQRHGEYNEERRKKAADMAGGLGFWCEPNTFECNVFNNEGDGIPDVDVCIIDLATFTREGYEAHMAIAFMGILQYVNNLAERDQYLARMIALLIDEAHLVTINPLLAPFLIKMIKMFRKLGVSPWLITQNITDFPAESEKMLSMIEWYIVMLASKKEIERIAKFKNFSSEKQIMMESCRKEDKKYTEGVILSNKTVSLFRAIPPSRILALAMTDKEEKAERGQLCQDLKAKGLPHEMVDGAIYKGELLDKARGIIS